MKRCRALGLGIHGLLGLGLVACSHAPIVHERGDESPKKAQIASCADVTSPQEFAQNFSAEENWWFEIRCDLAQEDLDSAREKLEAVLRIQAGKGHSSEAVAVFFLSEIYFRLGDLEKFSAYLEDARLRKAQLPAWIRDIELPLRSAQKELRLGFMKQYEELSRAASENLATYRQKGLIPEKEMATALLQLGYFRWSPQDSVEEFAQQIRLWNWSQYYLIQVLESSRQDLWPRAADLIVENYKAILDNITSWPREIASDPALSAHRQQESQWEMVYQTLHVMEELKILPLEPGENSSWLVKHVGELANVERDLRGIYFQQPVSSELTPAGRAQQRPLRTISPEPLFENESSQKDPNL